MCMITYIPGGVAIPWIGIYNGASWHEDGQGWACATPEGMFVGKSFDVDESLDALYEIRRQYPSAPALFHSRFGTHGELSERNIHPFYVGKAKDTVLAHNGVLPSAFWPKGLNWRSDTNNFALWLGRHENVLSRRGRQTIAELIGGHNKLVILTNNHRVYAKPRGFIVNESAGEWSEGCWFSNRDYKYKWTGKRFGASTQSWLWDGIDEEKPSVSLDSTSAIASKALLPAISTKAELTEDRLVQCPICKNRGGVELEANVCLHCDSCLDCNVPLRDCMCHWGNSLVGSSEESGIES